MNPHYGLNSSFSMSVPLDSHLHLSSKKNKKSETTHLKEDVYIYKI